MLDLCINGLQLRMLPLYARHPHRSIRGLNGFGGALTTGYSSVGAYLNALNIYDIFWHVASMLLSLGIHALQHLLE